MLYEYKMINKIPRTEMNPNDHEHIDQMETRDAMLQMLRSQSLASDAVKESIDQILEVAKKTFNHLSKSKSGRLIYCGAGTSGRIGVQDGVELYPTFNWPIKRLDYIIAGGERALLKSVENAEDNIIQAKEAISKKLINSQDVVIALAASGNTPFTCKVLEEANKKGALTIAISNNPKGKLLIFGKCKIILDTQAELISGSTRLKAGTAQKICLNIISSMVMVKMGRVRNGIMSSMVPTNKKLRDRKIRIDKQ